MVRREVLWSGLRVEMAAGAAGEEAAGGLLERCMEKEDEVKGREEEEEEEDEEEEEEEEEEGGGGDVEGIDGERRRLSNRELLRVFGSVSDIPAGVAESEALMTEEYDEDEAEWA